VHRGRDALNFSLWPSLSDGEEQGEDELFEIVLEGKMPPQSYALLHEEAQLSDSERRELVQGLQRTLGRAGPQAELEESGED
jgi:hypothetical protein